MMQLNNGPSQLALAGRALRMFDATQFCICICSTATPRRMASTIRE